MANARCGAVRSERPVSGMPICLLGARCRPNPDIGCAGLGAQKLTLVESNSGWPVWDLERKFPRRSIPSYTAAGSVDGKRPTSDTRSGKFMSVNRSSVRVSGASRTRAGREQDARGPCNDSKYSRR